MPDYKKMYCLLCKAIDDVIEPLENIPYASLYAEMLRLALQKAENIYIDTCEDDTAVCE